MRKIIFIFILFLPLLLFACSNNQEEILDLRIKNAVLEDQINSVKEDKSKLEDQINNSVKEDKSKLEDQIKENNILDTENKTLNKQIEKNISNIADLKNENLSLQNNLDTAEKLKNQLKDFILLQRGYRDYDSGTGNENVFEYNYLRKNDRRLSHVNEPRLDLSLQWPPLARGKPPELWLEITYINSLKPINFYEVEFICGDKQFKTTFSPNEPSKIGPAKIFNRYYEIIYFNLSSNKTKISIKDLMSCSNTNSKIIFNGDFQEEYKLSEDENDMISSVINGYDGLLYLISNHDYFTFRE